MVCATHWNLFRQYASSLRFHVRSSLALCSLLPLSFRPCWPTPTAGMSPPAMASFNVSPEHAEFAFYIKASKWPYHDKLAVSIPATSKSLKGTEAKLEITRLNVGRSDEILIKGADPRAVRHAGAGRSPFDDFVVSPRILLCSRSTPLLKRSHTCRLCRRTTGGLVLLCHWHASL